MKLVPPQTAPGSRSIGLLPARACCSSMPRLEVVPGQDDPAYMQVLPSRVTALEIVDASVTPVVDFFVRSPAGTRTFVVLRPIASAVTLRLELHRPASTLFAIAEETALLVELPIDAQPPWEV
jgi:hypothetical protein